MTIGIICEYNPPHKGHAYQIAALKNRYPDSTVICVMSGNYVQRGTPAIADKYLRASAALAIGADAVLELPFPYSCAPAELFARGGVAILAAVGIDALCFGTEGDVLPYLRRAAEQLDSPAFQTGLAELTADTAYRDVGFPVLRDRLYAAMFGEEEAGLLRTPNNTLGVEYLRALSRVGRPIEPIAIARTGDDHDTAHAVLPSPDAIVSASAVRALIGDGAFDAAMALLPPTTAQHLTAARDAGHLCTASDAALGTMILHTFACTPPEILSQYAGLEGGLAGRLCAAACRAHTAEELISLAATKKYTNAAIRRAALYGTFGITTEMLRAAPAYTTLLACGDRASAVLRRAQKEGALPILSRPAAYKKESAAVRETFLRALSADVVYGLCLPSPRSMADLLAAKPQVPHKT